MTDLRQAAQQALEALASYSIGERLDASQVNDLIAQLEAALEQQAEPPEWPLIKNILSEYGLDAIAFVAEFKAAQRQWVGLTDEEIKALASWWPSYDQMPALMVLAKEIQENLKERNHG